MNAGTPVIVAVLVVLGVAGCATDKSDWDRAIEANTIEALQQYVEKRGEGAFVGEARSKIMELRWAQISGSDSVAVFREFLAEFPGSPRKEDALSRVEGLLTVSEIRGLLYRPSAFAGGLIDFSPASDGDAHNVRVGGQITIAEDAQVLTGSARALSLSKSGGDVDGGLVGTDYDLVFLTGLEHRFKGDIHLPGRGTTYHLTGRSSGGMERTVDVGDRWVIGALFGTLTLDLAVSVPESAGAFRILGDIENPLVLRVASDGYKYVSGRGRVVAPGGRVYVFGS